MSTQPVGYDDAHDPAHILSRLPEREREQFLSEYRVAAETAAHEVWRYRHLQQLLHTWSMRAVACNKPDYYASREEAGSGAGEYTSLDDVIARRRAS